MRGVRCICEHRTDSFGGGGCNIVLYGLAQRHFSTVSSLPENRFVALRLDRARRRGEERGWQRREPQSAAYLPEVRKAGNGQVVGRRGPDI